MGCGCRTRAYALPPSRTFRGKVYHAISATASERDAKASVKKYRKDGYLARFTKDEDGIYNVWVHDKVWDKGLRRKG